MYLCCCRVLEQVNFESKFDMLPQFNPDDSETGTPLTRSPRDIIKSFKKRLRHNLGKTTQIMLLRVKYFNVH